MEKKLSRREIIGLGTLASLIGFSGGYIGYNAVFKINPEQRELGNGGIDKLLEIDPGRPVSYKQPGTLKFWSKGNMAGEVIKDGKKPEIRYSECRYDKNGFRNPKEFDNLGNFDVIFLGDSMVEQRTIFHEDLATTRLYEKTGIPVYNMGLGSLSVLDEYDILKKLGVSLNPRVVFWTLYGGDDFRRVRPFDYDTWSKRMKEFRSSNPSTQEDMETKSGGIVDEFPQGYKNRRNDGKLRFFHEPYEIEEKDWRLVSSTLEKAVELCKEQGAKIEFLYIPPKGQVYKPKKWKNFKAPGLMQELCAKIDAGYTDMTPRFREARTYLDDDIHLSEIGHEIIADTAANIINNKYPNLRK